MLRAGTSAANTVIVLLRSVGTEFKVMHELLRFSSLRSTLDVYTKAVTPAKHAAQATVLSPVFSSDPNGGPFSAGQERAPKTVQGILRHAKVQTTVDLYTQEDSDETRAERANS